jgi:hypothetical protein
MGFFSKLVRSVLRHIRVASKQALKDRLMAGVNYFKRDPVSGRSHMDLQARQGRLI